MQCSLEPDLTLDEWHKTLLSPLEGRRYPLSATVELTERCNMSCKHCYINQAAGDPRIQALELNTGQWTTIFDQIADAGCLFLLLTGGEPLLRPDFPELFTHVRQLGMVTSLFTNGTMLTPKIADLLSDLGLHSLEISLYGATEETYEKVTGVPGSYARCIRGIELALEGGLRLSLKSVILTINQHELALMQAMTEGYGLGFRYDSTIWPRTDGSMTPLQFQLSQAEMLALDKKDPKRMNAWKEVAKQFEGHNLREEFVYTCGAAQRSYHINARGRLTPCVMTRTPAYDLLEQPFLEAWKNLGAIRELKRQTQTDCETCTVNALCVQCPGWSLATHANLETPASFICALGHARAQVILSEIFDGG